MRHDDTIISPTERYLNALHELAEAELEMLAAQLGDECWQYAEVFVGNLADCYHLQFQFGDSESKPDRMGEARVMVHSSTRLASMDGPWQSPVPDDSRGLMVAERDAEYDCEGS